MHPAHAEQRSFERLRLKKCRQIFAAQKKLGPCVLPLRRLEAPLSRAVKRFAAAQHSQKALSG
jgi:hypothetical protein